MKKVLLKEIPFEKVMIGEFSVIRENYEAEVDGDKKIVRLYYLL